MKGENQMERQAQNGFNHVQITSGSPETITNNLYTPAFLRDHIGKLVRIQFLIGTNVLEDRTGILEEVGLSYVLLRSIESGNLLYCDIYSIKFVIIAENPYIGRADSDFQL